MSLSAWTKIRDDDYGIIAQSGQVRLEYHDDNTIRASVRIGNTWSELRARSVLGKWVHYALTYDGTFLRLFVNGVKSDELALTGSLHVSNDALRLGVDTKIILDDFRIYDKGLTEHQISLVYGLGSGDLGLRPLITGTSPFVSTPSPSLSVAFLEGNQTIYVNGLAGADLNVTGAAVQSFSDNNPSPAYAFELNAAVNPSMVRVEVPFDSVNKDQNRSQAGAFEFHHRVVTSVENDLLAWYTMDDFNGSLVLDSSGRERHARYHGLDATVPGGGNVTFSNSHATLVASNAFDNIDNAANGRWLARQNQFPNVFVRYDFGVPTEIMNYRVVAQHWQTANRSPKAWTLQGSNDDAAWTVLDTVTDQTGWTAWESRDYEVDNPQVFRYYKMVFTEATGADTWLGVAEIDLRSNRALSAGKFGNAIDLDQDYLDLPFRIDQAGTGDGLTFSAWVRPDQVQGGVDNERMIFSTDNGGWDWSLAFRYGSLTTWEGSTRVESLLQAYSGKWYHVVAVFDPVQGRTILYSNGQSTTLDSIGVDGNSDLIRVGRGYWGRTFDGLIDDVRVWGRPLSIGEVSQLWGNGMGDIGPQARFEFENPSFGQTIEATIFFNQSITDFNASQDLQLSGMTLASSTPVPGSTTSHKLVFNRASFTPGTLSLKLLGNSITDSFGMPNSEVAATIDFRPHRVREGDLALWWQLDETAGSLAVDSAGGDSNGTGSPIWFAPGKFGASGIEFDGTDGKALLSTGVSGDFESATLSLWVYPESPDFHLFSLEGTSPSMSLSLRKQRPLFILDGLDQQSLPGTSGDEFWAKGYLPLNQWSHLSLVYDLSSRMVRFYLNGSFDNESSFSGGKPSPSTKPSV